MRQAQTSEAQSREFALLWHQPPPESSLGAHWDLMIRDGAQLACWRLDKDLFLTERQIALRINDHRLAYLTYEGPLAENRGLVRQVDHGEFQVGSWSSVFISGVLRGTQADIEIGLTKAKAGNSWELVASRAARDVGGAGL